MNRQLLILGAGAHGNVVAETAAEMKCFQEIKFLDDNNKKNDIIGKLEDYQSFSNYYSDAFVALGDPDLRDFWLKKLTPFYNIPYLVHPRAWLSCNAKIEYGSIIESMACINTNTIVHYGAIIGIGALVDHDVKIGAMAHLDCGVVIPPRQQIPEKIKISAGTVFFNN